MTLPESLADLPQPLYFFDGTCVLCSGFVQFCFRHDGDGALKFASAQSPLGAHVLGALGLPADTLDRTILLVEGNEVFSQSTAILRSLRHLRGWPRWLLPLRWVPRVIRDPIYDVIARNRYRWFGQRPACFVPTPETRARFIDL
ncbi:MAG TPA: DCC1-like thiol-disulfide oxidoreductase family protein [Reyranella sp.]